MDLFTDAFRELREGIAKEGGVIAKKGSDEKTAPAKGGGKPDAKGGDKEKGKDTSDESRIKQAVYDIRYRAKRENIPVAQAMTDYLKHSGSLGPKARAELKTKLVGESVEVADEAYTVTNADKKGNTPAYQGYKAGKKNVKTGKPLYKAADHMKEDEIEEEGCSSKKKAYKESADTQKEGPSGDTLYKVRVKNNDGRSEIRYASRAKISQLRANSNITSVEITGHGEPYNKNAGAGADAKKENEKNAKARKDYDGDGKVESGSKEHAGAVHNAIQKKKGGKQDGQDTRKESFSDWRTDLEYLQDLDEHHQKDEDGNVVEHEGGEPVEESEKVAQGAYKRAQELGAKRRKSSNPRGIGKSERAGYNLSQSARSRNASLETQGGNQTGGGSKSYGFAKNKSNPVKSKRTGDTGALGHAAKRDEKQTTGKKGQPLKSPKYKLKFKDRLAHHSTQRQALKNPKNNPKHTANEEVEMEEASLATARKNIGKDPKKASCWTGYKAVGVKVKGGKSVPDCKKEEVDVKK